MVSKQPRTPEVEVSEDEDSGFKANIYDGEYLIQVRPHENGYQLSLASKTGMGDAAFLRTYGREERFRELLKTKFEAIDSDAVFEVLEEHFDEEEYRIVNLKESVKTFHGRGADLYVETGETIPTLTDDRDYRDDQWSKDNTYRLRIWPSNDLWIEIQDTDSGERVADYWPNSLLEDIRNEEKDDHGRERGPTSVPGVHAPVGSPKLENAPVVHTHIDCSHLGQLGDTRFNPEGEKPPKVPAGEFGELPLRWCSTCRHREPTPDEIRQQYGSSPE
jgi:hypothetical protein